jgi:hypothetical protein
MQRANRVQLQPQVGKFTAARRTLRRITDEYRLRVRSDLHRASHAPPSGRSGLYIVCYTKCRSAVLLAKIWRERTFVCCMCPIRGKLFARGRMGH